LVVQTTAGRVSVSRDFPSDYTGQVDRFLGEIFRHNPGVTGIEYLGLEPPHRICCRSFSALDPGLLEGGDLGGHLDASAGKFGDAKLVKTIGVTRLIGHSVLVR
jgi:hypothetical protein